MMTQATRIALVSGGNRGIGLAICAGLARQGVLVYLGCRQAEQGRAAVQRLGLENIQVLALDVCDEASLSAAIAQIQADHGRLDLLINNAGISQGIRDAVSSESMDQARHTFEVNFFGPWRLTQLALPLLHQSTSAQIINISSGYGSSSKVSPTNLAYCSSKAALNAFTRALAAELAESRIRVTTMTPGWVRTKMGGIGAPRSPEEGAETVLWLALEGGGEHGQFYKDREIFPW